MPAHVATQAGGSCRAAASPFPAGGRQTSGHIQLGAVGPISGWVTVAQRQLHELAPRVTDRRPCRRRQRGVPGLGATTRATSAIAMATFAAIFTVFPPRSGSYSVRLKKSVTDPALDQRYRVAVDASGPERRHLRTRVAPAMCCRTRLASGRPAAIRAIGAAPEGWKRAVRLRPVASAAGRAAATPASSRTSSEKSRSASDGERRGSSRSRRGGSPAPRLGAERAGICGAKPNSATGIPFTQP